MTSVLFSSVLFSFVQFSSVLFCTLPSLHLWDFCGGSSHIASFWREWDGQTLDMNNFNKIGEKHLTLVIAAASRSVIFQLVLTFQFAAMIQFQVNYNMLLPKLDKNVDCTNR